MAARAEVYERLDAENVLSLDPETLDSSLHYRFVEQRNLARRKSQGYEVVLRSESGVKLQSDDESMKTADDLIRVGSTVLMACSQTKFKERRAKVAKLAKSRLDSGEQQFEGQAQRRNVRTVTGEKGD